MAKANTKIIATLTRGTTYSMREGDIFLRFARGQRVEVSAATRARLEATAKDWVTRPHPETDAPTGVFIPKFQFEEIQSA